VKIRISEKTYKDIVIPDHYSYDQSRLGLVADVIMGGDRRREDIFSDNSSTVRWAISDVREAYDKAEKIMKILFPDQFTSSS
jgi:hypothetical protein